MIDIRTGEIADILPVEFTRQPEVLAISYALKQAYQTYLNTQKQIYVYAFIDGAPDYVLDLLAVELHVRYYQDSFDLETKRSLIKSAILVGLKDGTTYAVNTVIATIFGEGRVTEWYDYNGTPNHYRIDLEVDNSFEIETMLSMIESVKRKTARLDGVMMHGKLEHELFYGFLMTELQQITINCAEIPDIGEFRFLVNESSIDLVTEDGAYLFELITEEEASA